jgi:hypothetical protein
MTAHPLPTAGLSAINPDDFDTGPRAVLVGGS